MSGKLLSENLRLKSENEEMNYILKMLRLQFRCSNSEILDSVLRVKKLLKETDWKCKNNEQSYLNDLASLKNKITKLEAKRK